MWNLNEYFAVEVSDVKTFNTASKRRGFANQNVKRETYVTVTLFDKSTSVNGMVKSVNIRNPFPAFIVKLKTDLELWSMTKVPVKVKIEDSGEMIEKVINLTKVELNMPNGREELTNPIPKQIENLSHSMNIVAYSTDNGNKWISSGNTKLE